MEEPSKLSPNAVPFIPASQPVEEIPGTVFGFANNATADPSIISKEVSAEENSVVGEDEEDFMRNKREDRNRKSKHPKLTLSTTSSVYAEHTISNPDNDQVNYCISAILQAQVFDDTQNPDLKSTLQSFFEVELNLPAEYGGNVAADHIPEAILNHETLNDLELREKLLQGTVPTVDTIYRFISMLIGYAEFSVECNILGLIFINRLTGRHKIPLTIRNFRGLWISVIILAQKVWDDQPLKTSSFTRILPGTTKERLKELELRAFQLLDYNTTVKPSVYAKYYFELRHLFKEIVGSNPRYHWKMEPLTYAEGKRLEHRSQLRGSQKAAKPELTPGGKSTVKTLDDVELLKSPSRYVIS